MSIIREMATIQYAINEERSESKKRIAEEREQSESIVGKTVRRQVTLERLLRAVCVKKMPKGRDNVLACEYGDVQYADERLRVTLNPDVAWKQRGKP